MTDRYGRSPLDADDEPAPREQSLYERLGMAEPGASPGATADPEKTPPRIGGAQSADDLFAAAAPPRRPAGESGTPPRPAGWTDEPPRTDRDETPGAREVPPLPPGAPEYLDLDIESEREGKLTAIALAFLVATFIFFALSVDSHKHGRRRPAIAPGLFPLVPICLTIGGIFGILRLGTRDVHRLHVRRGEIAMRTAFFSPGVEAALFRRGDLATVFVRTHTRRNKNHTWLEYSIHGTDRHGLTHLLAKERKGNDAVLEDARLVAAAMRAGFDPVGVG